MGETIQSNIYMISHDIPQQLEETLGIFKFDNAQSVKSANSHEGWY